MDNMDFLAKTKLKTNHGGIGIDATSIENNYNRIISVGDIHGCLDALKYHLEHIQPTKDDLLIFLGDYIDRGPDSPGVIEFLLNLKSKVDCVFLRGNHDSMFLNFFGRGGIYGRYFTHIQNGGQKTLKQYRFRTSEIYEMDQMFDPTDLTFKKFCEHKIPKAHVDFMQNTYLFIEFDHAFYSHAGFNNFSAVDYDCQTEEDYTWSRDAFLLTKHTHKLNKLVVHGHTRCHRDKTKMPDINMVYNDALNNVNLDVGSFDSDCLASLIVIPNRSETKIIVSNYHLKENLYGKAAG